MKMKVLARAASLVFGILAMAAVSYAQIGIGISVRIAPPELPVYEQPICPGDGYLWTPGYWGYADDDYYWIPGTWVEAPEVGFFWTPGYWGWGGDAFLFHEGYWGPQVGFYGGISYGFGYFGHGYEGGRWDGGHFFYNRTVNNVNVSIIHNTYNTTIVNENRNVTHVSYNGGTGGIDARATADEEAAARARHVGPVAAQTQHVEAARANPQLRASYNHGKPPIAATPRPGAFTDKGVVAAREGPAGAGGKAGSPAPVHPRDIPASERPAAPNTGNPKVDQKYQKQQDKLAAQQTKERQKLQQQQDKDHQQLAKKNVDEASKQQVEQRHQQQTQQLMQRHTQQQQQLQSRQQPAARPEHH
jgi:hypothetical protein